MTRVGPATGGVTAYFQTWSRRGADGRARSRLIEIHTCSVTKDQLTSAPTKPGIVTIRQTPAVARHPNPSAARAGVSEAGRDPGVSVAKDESQQRARSRRRDDRSAGIATASPSTRLLAQRSAANSMALAHRAVRADPANEGPLPPSTTAGSAKSRIGTRRDFRIRGKRRCSALDVTTLPSIVSEYHRRLSSSFGSRRLRPLSSPACPQVIVYVNGAGLRRSRATTATRRGSRSPRSPGGLDGRRRQSRHTFTTRLRLTKGPDAHDRPR